MRMSSLDFPRVQSISIFLWFLVLIYLLSNHSTVGNLLNDNHFFLLLNPYFLHYYSVLTVKNVGVHSVCVHVLENIRLTKKKKSIVMKFENKSSMHFPAIFLQNNLIFLTSDSLGSWTVVQFEWLAKSGKLDNVSDWIIKKVEQKWQFESRVWINEKQEPT